MRALIRSIGLVAVPLVIAACERKAATPPPPPADQTPPPAAAPLSVTTVDLGKSIGPDKRVTAPTTTFGTRDTIFASVATSGAATNATLAARWSFESGQLVDSTAVAIAPSGPAVTEFHVMRASPWPTGKYKVAILLNGQQVSEKEFEVKR